MDERCSVILHRMHYSRRLKCFWFFIEDLPLVNNNLADYIAPKDYIYIYICTYMNNLKGIKMSVEDLESLSRCF
jgi:hypothetical protein